MDRKRAQLRLLSILTKYNCKSMFKATELIDQKFRIRKAFKAFKTFEPINHKTLTTGSEKAVTFSKINESIDVIDLED